MSDTDDTDLLLLIPPNFFNIQSSDSVDSVRKKNSRLTTLVDDLSNRMDALEVHIREVENEDEFEICATPRTYMSGNLPNLQNNIINNVQASVSLNSCKQERKQNEQGESNNIHQYFNRPKIDNEEIFLNIYNTETTRDISKSRISLSSQADSAKKCGNHIQPELNNSLKYDQVDSSLQAYINENNYSSLQKNLNSHKIGNKPEQQITSLPDYNASVKHMNNECANDKSICNRSILNNCNSLRNDLHKSGKETIFHNKYTSLAHKNIYEQHVLIPQIPNMPFTEPGEYPKTPKNIISLSKVFSNDDRFLTVSDKLETEKLKRQHCEEVIHNMEKRILELEQKIAVAVNVDTQKEEMINTLTEAWTKLTYHWKQLEEHRHQLVLTLEQERMLFRESTSFTTQKIKDFESKLLMAIRLLADCNQKNEQIEMEKRCLIQQITSADNKFEQEINQLKRNITLLKTDNTKLMDECRIYNTEITSKHCQLTKTSNQIYELENCVKSLTDTNFDLTSKLKTEQEIVIMLNNKIRTLQNTLDGVNKSSKVTKEDLNVKNEEISKLKVTLKDYYQTQLEQIVKEKFLHLQRKLDKAEKIVQTQQQRREQQLNESFDGKIQQLQAFHRMELKHLKKKYDEQIGKFKLEIKDKENKISSLEDDLKTVSWNKFQLVKRLQKTMQNQWLETLNVIVSDKNQQSETFIPSDFNMFKTSSNDPTTDEIFHSGNGKSFMAELKDQVLSNQFVDNDFVAKSFARVDDASPVRCLPADFGNIYESFTNVKEGADVNEQKRAEDIQNTDGINLTASITDNYNDKSLRKDNEAERS